MAIGQVRWRRGKVGGKSCWFGASVQADTHTLVHTPFEYRHGWEEGFILASKGIGAAQLELSRDDDKGGGVRGTIIIFAVHTYSSGGRC